MFNSSFPGTIHSDVLGARPTSIEDRQSLVEELKRRAKGSISTKNYPEAIQLYSKGLEICDGDVGKSSILHGNISMCWNAMNKFDDALESANQSIKADSQYVKAYYRKAMALMNLRKYTEAKETLQEGLKIKPDDKEIIQQLDKVQMEIVKNGNGDSKPSSINVDKKPNTVFNTSITTTTTASGATTTKKTIDDPITDQGDQDGETIMRGYKIVDGKKTTFFNNQLDEKTKELIGSIEPKKIDAKVEVTSVNGSVWNQAGTFESVGFSPYAKETLKKLLKEVKLTNDNHIITITKTDIEGDAEIISKLGRRKHVYDFSIKNSFLICIKNENSYEGQINIEDVTADREYEFSISYDKSAANYNSDVENIINSDIKSKSGIKKNITEKLFLFDDEFKSK